MTWTPLSRSKGQRLKGRGILWRPPAHLVKLVIQQAVRVATQYAPPLLSPWAPQRLARRRVDAINCDHITSGRDYLLRDD